jgi:phosphoribosylformylglycinamidine cyclo-ligase
MEIYCSQTIANDIIDISKEFNVEAKVIGFVENSSKNELIIKSKEGNIEY